MFARSIILLFSLSLAASQQIEKASSKIIKTKCLEDALKYIDSETTAIFDLDETLVLSDSSLTQPNTVETFNKAKSLAEKTFSITARPPSFYAKSHDELTKLGIAFDTFMVTNNYFYCNWLSIFPMNCRYFNGIVSVGRVPKGEGFIKFLKLTGYKPKKIVFVDDLEKNIKSMANAAKSLNIPYVGIWYVRHAS